MTSLVIVGQGYVGLPMAIRAAEANLRVVGYDTSESVVELLNRGESHVSDVSPEEVSRAIAAGRYQATSDPRCLERADVVLVSVPTPLSEEGGPDLEAVRSAAETIGRHIRENTLVILESTTYPGTTEEVFAPLVCGEGLTPGIDVNIAFSPERIDPGNQTFGVRNTPKVVGGLTDECTKRAAEFYSRFVDNVVTAKGVREAEMSKLIENTFRHVNIALVNEMLRFSHDLDIDLWDAIDCAETKPFGFMAFRPGPGVGGHCIPVDPSYLSHRVRARLGYSFRMVELAEEINVAAPLYVAARATELLNTRRIPANGARICILGVAYKANISDRRESPADPLARRLHSMGVELSYADPHVPEWRVGELLIPRVTSLSALNDGNCDLAILLQDHRAYMDEVRQLSAPLLDTRGAVAESDHTVRL